LLQGDAICFCGLFQEKATLHFFYPLSKIGATVTTRTCSKWFKEKCVSQTGTHAKTSRMNVFVAVFGGRPLASGKLKKQKKGNKTF
jgi:hypothetical protein